MKKNLRFLSIEHVDNETPNIFMEFSKPDNVKWRHIRLDKGEKLPSNPDFFDAIWVMGGPMNVWQTKEFPWLIDEMDFLKHRAQDNQPIVGVCLGHQLLAQTFGGLVAPGNPEIGMFDIELTDKGRAYPVFSGLPEIAKCLQWHSAEIKTLPERADILASSPICEVQAMAIGDNIVSVQFHFEFDKNTVGQWMQNENYARELTDKIGKEGLRKFQIEAQQAVSECHKSAKSFYDNWLNLIK